MYKLSKSKFEKAFNEILVWWNTQCSDEEKDKLHKQFQESFKDAFISYACGSKMLTIEGLVIDRLFLCEKQDIDGCIEMLKCFDVEVVDDGE